MEMNEIMKRTKKNILAFSYVLFLSLTLSSFASANISGQIQQGLQQIQAVLTGLVVIVGVCAGVWIVLKKLPGIDDPHTKNEMFRGIGYVLGGVATAAALIWLVPWVFNLFS